MVQTGVEQGIWKLEQDNESMVVRLLKYGQVIDEWVSDRVYKWEELYDLLLKKSYERRSEK